MYILICYDSVTIFIPFNILRLNLFQCKWVAGSPERMLQLFKDMCRGESSQFSAHVQHLRFFYSLLFASLLIFLQLLLCYRNKTKNKVRFSGVLGGRVGGKIIP